MKYLFIILSLFFILDPVAVQSQDPLSKIPGVFLIGEYEDQYMSLSKQHPAIFMSVYHNDIDIAFREWSYLLMDIEEYAEELDFDIKGVKLWINLYFNSDGTIQHLAFFPKPNSRNVPVEHLTAFFKNFVRDYSLDVEAAKPFQHNASASFPTFFSREMVSTGKKN